MAPAPIEGVVLDHVAHAVSHWRDAWGRYAVDFGATWSSGGPGPGFAPGQVRLANDARIELLMPHDTGVNDFLDRFLRTNGPGAHHLTFKVADIRSAIARARDSGFEPIGIDLRDPEWLEAFLHPKQATGVVVQLAQASTGWSSPAPDEYPTRRRLRRDGNGPTAPASLLGVVHVVADLAPARDLFAGLLGGRVAGEGTGRGLTWLDLAWPGPLRLRLVAPDDRTEADSVAGWLAGRPGRVHHLLIGAEEPDGVPDARPAGADEPLSTVGPDHGRYWVVGPEANAGLRLVITDAAGE